MTRILTVLSLVCVLTAIWPVWRFWRSFRHTALRSAAVWVGLTTAVWVFASALAVFEPESSRWDWLNLVRLFACATLLTPIVAALGARRPGELAWNFIVVTLLLIFAQPIVEHLLLGTQIEPNRVGLNTPRATFYSIIAAVGVLNYLPTRFGIASLFFAIATGFCVAALGPWPAISASDVTWRSATAGITLSLAVWSAWWLSRGSNRSATSVEWERLRDGWGFVWSTRVRERWNAAARFYGWNLRLDSNGIVPAQSSQAVTPSAREAGEEHLRHLLKRFLECGY